MRGAADNSFFFKLSSTQSRILLRLRCVVWDVTVTVESWGNVFVAWKVGGNVFVLCLRADS